MADIYKKVTNKEQKSRSLTTMSVEQSTKVQSTIQNFVNYFKNA